MNYPHHYRMKYHLFYSQFSQGLSHHSISPLFGALGTQKELGSFEGLGRKSLVEMSGGLKLLGKAIFNVDPYRIYRISLLNYDIKQEILSEIIEIS